MRILAAALLCLWVAAPAHANLIITVNYSGTVNGFTDDLTVFTGPPNPVTPITNIHGGDAFTGTTTFDFDLNNQDSSRPDDLFGSVITTVKVDGHTFSTAPFGTNPEFTQQDVLFREGHTYGFVYQNVMGSQLPLNTLFSELDLTGGNHSASTNTVLDSLVADLADFQGGHVGFTRVTNDPGVWSETLDFLGNVDRLDGLTVATPEPATWMGALAGLGFAWAVRRKKGLTWRCKGCSPASASRTPTAGT